MSKVITLKPPAGRVFAGAVDMLTQLPDVVAVCWGSVLVKGRWKAGLSLSVHVRPAQEGHVPERLRLVDSVRSRLPAKLIPAAGIPAIAVADAGGHRLDHTDRVAAKQRGSTAAVFAHDHGRTFGLLSGHGALPFVDGTIIRSFPSSEWDGPPPTVRVEDFSGEVLAGGFGSRGSVDWCVAEFPDARAADVDSFHLAVGGRSPMRARRAAISQGTVLWHYSRMPEHRHRHIGAVRQIGIAVGLSMPDGSTARYSDLLVVSSDTGEPYSIAGDSGSLVVDDAGDAVGTIVGGAPSRGISYVMRLRNLQNQFAEESRFDVFFR